MSALQEFHILQIEDATGSRTVLLTAATYSVGRDKASNGIVISDPAASRNHAMFLRMPLPGNKYQYRLVDGDVTGRRSTNGVLVNGSPTTERKLRTGDKIIIGERAQLSYLIAQMTQAEYDQYFNADSPQFHSLKEEALDPTGTLMTIIAN